MSKIPTNLPKVVTNKYSVLDNTFVRIVKDNPQDTVEIEVGDSKQPSEFIPQFKVMRWGNEVNFSVRAEMHENAVVKTKGEVIQYVAPEYEVHQYDKPEASEDGGFEFEWILKSKPTTNVLKATVDHKNVDFYYQPPLTADDVVAGHRQEERVAGSYAVYHSGDIKNIEGATLYRAGKVAHIYRPEAFDSTGVKVWCKLMIDGSELTVEVPQDFLDTAVYPITVDPTFGYTTAPANEWTGVANNSQADLCSTANQRTAVSGDTITSFSAYIRRDSIGTFRASMAAYRLESGSPTSRLAAHVTASTTSDTPVWATTSTVSQALTASHVYGVALSAVDTVDTGSWYYDSGSVPGRYLSNHYDLPATFVVSGTESGSKWGVYATYTAGGSSNLTNLKTADGLAKASVKTFNGLVIASTKTRNIL